MNLTADEATKFWPVFDQYRKDAIKPNDERWALIKEYAKNYNTMTEAQAQDYMKRATAPPYRPHDQSEAVLGDPDGQHHEHDEPE